MALTDKHMRFIDEYLKDMNGTAAYLRAGYKCREDVARINASRLLSNANISQEIATKQAKLQVESGITVKWVLDNFKSVAERCMQAEAILDREGNPTGEYRFDSSGANKALESIGKHLGMFKDKVEHSGEVTYTHRRLEEMQDDELERIVNGAI